MRGLLSNNSLYGFTLLELLITLSITAILLSISIPSFKEMVLESQAESTINHISRLIRLARNTAVTQGTTSTLCPSSDGKHCDGVWKEGVLLFTDKNKNGALDGEDIVIQFLHPFFDQGDLTFKSFRNLIQFSAKGTPQGTIGSFIYCPSDNNIEHAKALILNFQGRLRRGYDFNNDGIEEAGNHRNISCT